MLKSKFYAFCLIIFAFSLSISAQSLTVRDIMREPSLAGMRPENEKLSPDGKFVVFAWNAEGKEPRNLYIVSTSSGGEPKILVDAEKNYEMRTPAPESKLNYGLNVRDDFAKAREKNIGGTEISPDSKRILFTQNSDIYVLDLESDSAINNFQRDSMKLRWKNLESAFIRQSDLLPNVIRIMQLSGIANKKDFLEIVGQIADNRNLLIKTINENPKAENGDKTPQQKETVLNAAKNLTVSINRLKSLKEVYSEPLSNDAFTNVQDELSGTENRIRVYQLDYNDVANNLLGLNPRRITRTQGSEFAARWLDDSTILYQSSGNFFALNIDRAALVQLSKEANPQAFTTVSAPTATKDAKFLAYIVADGAKQRTLVLPNYLDEFVQAPTFRRGFTEQKVLVVKTDGSSEKPVEIKLPKAEGASYLRGLDWAADNRSLIVDRVDKDTKRRQLFYIYHVGDKDEQIITITEETDEKWIGSLSRIVEPNPKDNSQILFASEKDGFNHLYLATLEKRQAEPNPTGEVRQENPSNAGFSGKVEIKQLTKGNYEVDWAKWEFQGNAIVYSSTQENTSARQFYSIRVGEMERTNWSFTPYKLPNSELYKGMKTNPQLEDSVLLFRYSEWNKPDELYVTDRLHDSNLKTDITGLISRITKTTPESFLNRKWNAPQFVDIPARDGKLIKSKVYTPSDFSKSKKYPMVIFVHGAGYLQNTINGWNNYSREFMFNELLTQKGYVVLDIDYRGSAGYGRDWRTDVYDFLGGKDYEDELDAIDFAVKNYAVDAKKVGVYGGSYGGFMAEMMAFRTDKIACAAALRPVADWKNYYASSPVYTVERLGFPDKNPEGYKRSSPISYAENLDKPLLILHGLVDDNVTAQDSIQLTERLIRLEKTEYFDEMIYPAESHGFVRPTSWTDEYTRILMFFEKHLK